MKRLLATVAIMLLTCLALCLPAQAEQWRINFNSHQGTMELTRSGDNYTGRFNLHGNWEQMLDLQVYRSAIFFRRAAADQKYIGVLEDGRMQGVFTQHGSGRYPWTAERMAAQPPVAVVPQGPGYQAPGAGNGIPVTIFWHMADNADVYLNGRPLRDYTPSFKTRPDEAPRPAFSARAILHNGDIFTVGGRRGGSYGLMLIAVDDSNRIVFKTDRTSWAVYEPGERPDWFDPSVANASAKRLVTVQPDPWYPQKELNAKYNNSALSIWSEPDKRFAYLLGMVKLAGSSFGALDPTGVWRHSPGASWVITQNPDGSFHGQEHGLGNASGPAYFTQQGNFRIDYVTRDGSIRGFYEVTFAPDGYSAVGRVQELNGPRRSGTTSWQRER